MLNRSTRYLLASIEAIIGWEWLMSGGNKLLSGTFPQGLADALKNGMNDNPNGWYVNILQAVVVPHSVFYGYLVEWSEVAIGLALIGGALMLLGEPRMRWEAQHGLAVAYSYVVILAAAGAAFQTINFHFLMGGWVFPVFKPSAPFNEGVDLDGFIPPICLVIIIANLAMIRELRGGSLLGFFRRRNEGAVEAK
jgi:thiosulfate dehydrogenase (quinone) large subunit